MNTMPPSQPPSSLPSHPTPVPHVVHIRTKPGGWWTGIGVIAVLVLFGLTFIMGIILGVGAMVAGASVDTVVLEHTYRDGRARDKIAILPVEGIIDDNQAHFVRSAVDHILSDRHIKAVILRVNSPGGGVTASDQIWYEVERLKRGNLPVVASYGGLAASGGYYISSGANHIIAEETTITGSIGVIAQIMTLHGLMDKVGIEPITLVATGSPEKSVGNDIFRQWTEEDQKKWMNLLDQAYDIFTQRVAAGRTATLNDPEKLKSAASGSVFSAREALNNGLIDAIGYLDDAVADAERRGGIAAGRAHVVRITPPPSLMGALFGASPAPMSMDAERLRSFVNELSTPKAMYLMW